MSLTKLNKQRLNLEMEKGTLLREMRPLIKEKFSKRLAEKTGSTLNWSYSFMRTNMFDAEMNTDHPDYNYFDKWMRALNARDLGFDLEDGIRITITQEVGYYRYFFNAYFRDGCVPWGHDRVVQYILDKGWKFSLAVARKKLEQDLAHFTKYAKNYANRVLAIQSVLDIL